MAGGPGWLVGPGLHLLCLAAVFDIHFKSPLVHSPLLPSSRPNFTAPADRLVLFVADGLRAESFYQAGAAPYLHSRPGVVGLSHTAVPTESRPGHVALLAGLLEDPSAITRGWTENPVEFDSILNRSSGAWSWGSPDILPMFARGAPPGHVTMEMYDPEFEDFSSQDSAELDRWVFHRLTGFLSRAGTDVDLRGRLARPGTFLFLHLLGCDTNGHVHKPHSRQYRDNIRTVDEGIERAVAELERHFGQDGRTAYVFTADHGMTDWGSHGTGQEHETVTPLVAWGAGVAAPGGAGGQGFHGYPVLEGRTVPAVRQVDLAPLMATLLGVAVPRHSLGRLPVSLLALGGEGRAAALAGLVEQLGGQYRELRAGPASGLLPRLFHSEFPGQTALAEGEARAAAWDRARAWGRAVEERELLVTELLRGIQYYQRYQAVILTGLLQATYLGCIATNLAGVVLGLGLPPPPRPPARLLSHLSLLAAGLAVLCWLCQTHLPLHLLLYYLAPVFAWRRALSPAPTAPAAPNVPGLRHLGLLLATLGTLASIAAAFHQRRWLALGLLCPGIHIASLGPGWPRPWTLLTDSKKQRILKNALLAVLPLLLAAFPWLPPLDGRSSLLPVVLASGACVSFLHLQRGTRPRLLALLPLLAGGLVLLSALHPAPLLQLPSWLLLLSSLPLALRSAAAPRERGPALALGLTGPYLLLALSYESLLLPCLGLGLEAWLALERRAAQAAKEGLGARAGPRQGCGDVLCIVSFVFLNFYSFFATGNIASLNSFDPSSIRCLVAVFNPFLMGALLLLKILIPFLLVSVHFIQILSVRGLDSSLVTSVIQLCCDCLGLVFFSAVTHTGSWLEIGSSLSHFVIIEGSSLAITLLLGAAGLLYRVSI